MNSRRPTCLRSSRESTFTTFRRVCTARLAYSLAVSAILDALHLAASIRLDVDALVTYDIRLAGAAEEIGLPVIRPGV